MNQESTTDGGLADALGLDQDFETMASKARDDIEEFVQERPHAALALAAAAGFVIGGGLTPRRLFRLIVAAGGPLLSKQMGSQVLRVITDAMAEGASPDGPAATANGLAGEDEAKPKRSRRPRAAPES